MPRDDEWKALVKGTTSVISQVRNIIKQNNGIPDPRPPVTCGWCGKQSTRWRYSSYNGHVAFQCEHGDNGFVQ